MPGALFGSLGLRLLDFDLNHLSLQLQFLNDLLFGFGAVFALVFFLNFLLDSLQLLFEFGHRGRA